MRALKSRARHGRELQMRSLTATQAAESGSEPVVVWIRWDRGGEGGLNESGGPLELIPSTPAARLGFDFFVLSDRPHGSHCFHFKAVRSRYRVEGGAENDRAPDRGFP